MKFVVKKLLPCEGKVVGSPDRKGFGPSLSFC
jgi:hypothetical protein